MGEVPGGMKSRQSPQAQNEAGAHTHSMRFRQDSTYLPPESCTVGDQTVARDNKSASRPFLTRVRHGTTAGGVLRMFHAAFRVHTVLRVSGELLPTLRVLKRVEHSAPWSVLEFPVACSECFVPSRIYTFFTAFPSLRQCRLRLLSRQRGEHLQVTREPHRAVCHGEDVEGKQ